MQAEDGHEGRASVFRASAQSRGWLRRRSTRRRRVCPASGLSGEGELIWATACWRWCAKADGDQRPVIRTRIGCVRNVEQPRLHRLRIAQQARNRSVDGHRYRRAGTRPSAPAAERARRARTQDCGGAGSARPRGVASFYGRWMARRAASAGERLPVAVARLATLTGLAGCIRDGWGPLAGRTDGVAVEGVLVPVCGVHAMERAKLIRRGGGRRSPDVPVSNT